MYFVNTLDYRNSVFSEQLLDIFSIITDGLVLKQICKEASFSKLRGKKIY